MSSEFDCRNFIPSGLKLLFLFASPVVVAKYSLVTRVSLLPISLDPAPGKGKKKDPGKEDGPSCVFHVTKTYLITHPKCVF